VKILAVDTALGACSAALIAGDTVLAEDWREMARGHAEALAPMVEALMARATVAFKELDRLAVTTGPGTFAGQRVGLAFMRALALALKKPLVGITTLDAMAAAALFAEPSTAWAIAAADAKRDEIYLGARERERGLLDPILLPLALAPQRIGALAAEREGPITVAGTASEMVIPLLHAAGLAISDSGVRQPHAVHVAKLAISAAVGQPPKPLYLRPPDAKLPPSVP
jgi:tRNA threonylcarbamoyladenosine biosynthesis protein TsaB